MKNTLLEIKNLKKTYHNKDGETEAINNITLDIYPNEIVAIVGPSGCGKSTLLSILTNLEEKSDGTIQFNSDKKIGYMLQNDSLFPWLTILDNCLIGLEVSKNKNEETQKLRESIGAKFVPSIIVIQGREISVFDSDDIVSESFSNEMANLLNK